jgi:hypothetical protein
LRQPEAQRRGISQANLAAILLRYAETAKPMTNATAHGTTSKMASSTDQCVGNQGDQTGVEFVRVSWTWSEDRSSSYLYDFFTAFR